MSSTDENKQEAIPKDADLLKELESSLGQGDNADLMKDLEKNLEEMQTKLKDSFSGLEKQTFTGKSSDGHFSISITGTNQLEDIDFGKPALQGGISEFKWRIKEAWKSALAQVQEATQKTTMDLLGDMNLPTELQGLVDQKDED